MQKSQKETSAAFLSDDNGEKTPAGALVGTQKHLNTRCQNLWTSLIKNCKYGAPEKLHLPLK